MSDLNIPSQEKKESYFHKRITKEPIAFFWCFLFDVVMLGLFVGFAMLPYVLIEKAYAIHGIQNWFHKFLWVIHTPSTIIAVTVMVLAWEYWIHAPFSDGFLSNKAYRYKLPRISALLGIPVPPKQLHKDR